MKDFVEKGENEIMQEVISKVEKQELEIIYIKKTLDELVTQTKKQNEQLVKISEGIQKQEVILEKISNLEEKYQDGLKRCHKRIDEELERCKENNSIMRAEIERIKVELANKPCQTHIAVDKELEWLKKQSERHSKIFWWVGTLILGVVIIAMVKAHLKG